MYDSASYLPALFLKQDRERFSALNPLRAYNFSLLRSKYLFFCHAQHQFMLRPDGNMELSNITEEFTNTTITIQPLNFRLKVPCIELANQPLDEWLIGKFLLSSAAAPVVLFVWLVLYKLVKGMKSRLLSPEISLVINAFRRAGGPDTPSNSPTEWLSNAAEHLHLTAQHLLSTTNPWGQILNFLTFMSNFIVYGIYLTEVSYRNFACVRHSTACLLSCYQGSILNDSIAGLEFGLNCYFVVHFAIRFTASHHKLWFLTDLFSIMDYCTIPPTFVSFYTNRSWTGFRFVRILYLLNVPDFLQYIQLFRNQSPMRFCQLICTITAILLTTAGLFHLLENSTDIFNEAEVMRETGLSYWEYVYFCIVTAGTVGYGDIKCITAQGRIFNAIFILSTLAVVASILPDMFRIISQRKKYGGECSERGALKHIVVCGNINFITAGGFLREFLHKDRGSCDTKVIFLDLREPDVEMEILLKCHFNDVEYLQGSVMHSNDLKRAKVEACEACIITANKFCADPDAEDASNIMRVISIKNHNSSTRVIVELMQYHNKAYLLNIPSWNWKTGDEFVCLAELKLGLISQSCIAPGFSTLMANLFMSRSVSAVEKYTGPGWKSEYLRGTGMEMYTEMLSYSFVGLTFAEAAETCLLKLDILLLAVSFWDSQTEDYSMDINPKPSLIIEPRTQGFFIADSADDVQRAATYCSSCHADIQSAELIKHCHCGPFSFGGNNINIVTQVKAPTETKAGRKCSFIYMPKAESPEIEIFLRNRLSIPTTPECAYQLLEPQPGTYLVVPVLNVTKSDHSDHLSETAFDFGMPGPEQDLIAMDEQIRNCKFDSTGMFHWCAPRSFESALMNRYAAAKKQFHGHVVVGIFADTHSPLIGLSSLVMPLRSSNFSYDELKPIVFLGNTDYLAREWKNLHNFPKIIIVKGTALSRADLRALSIHSCSMCVVLTAKVPHTNDANLTDKEVIMASLNIKAMDSEPRATSAINSRQNSFKGVSRKGSQVFPDNGARCNKPKARARVPMITDLFNDSNVHFLDPDDDDDVPYPGFYATKPFACGTAFTASVLDSLMSMVYFNPNAFRVIRALIFGGASAELEEILAEGAGLIGGAQLPDHDKRNRSYVTQIKLTDPLFTEYARHNFGELFVGVLYKYGILCLGIFRLLNEAQGDAGGKRYVITKPSPNTSLRASDHIFALMQSDFSVQKQTTSNRHSSPKNLEIFQL